MSGGPAPGLDERVLALIRTVPDYPTPGLGGVVTGVGVLIELGFLHGRSQLGGYDLRALVRM